MIEGFSVPGSAFAALALGALDESVGRLAWAFKFWPRRARHCDRKRDGHRQYGLECHSGLLRVVVGELDYDGRAGRDRESTLLADFL